MPNKYSGTNSYSDWHGLLNDVTSDYKPYTVINKTEAPGRPVLVSTTPSKPSTNAKAVDSVNAKDDNSVTISGTKVSRGTTGRPWAGKYTSQTKPDGSEMDIWEFLSVPYRFITSSVLTGGAMYQYLARAGGYMFDFSPEADKIINKESDRFWNMLNKSWTDPWADITMTEEQKALKEQEQPHHLDIGTAIQYNIGQLGTLVGEFVTGGGYDSGTPIIDATDDEAMATFNKTAVDWGFVGGNLNFDPFSDKQRSLIVGDKYDPITGERVSQGSGWTVGNVLVQTTNLAGDIALDPITYIPIGNIVKGINIAARGSRYLPNLTGAETVGKVISRDADNLSKIALLDDAGTLTGRYASKKEAEVVAGGKLDYWHFTTFLAENSAETILKHPVIKSIPSSERSQVAWLLGQTRTQQDAARVLLATDYGSQRAFAELVSRNPNLTLALDEALQGGYLARQATKGLDDAVISSADNQSFYQMIGHYSDQLAADDFSRILSETMVKYSTEGAIAKEAGMALTAAGRGATAARELMPSTWALTNRINNFGAHMGSFIVHASTWEGATVVTRALTKFGSSKLYHQVVRPFQTSAKGMINVEDATGSAGEKFFGMIGDIDRLTRGAFTKEGLRKEVTEKWLKATTPQERADVIQYAQELGLTKLAEKHFGDVAVNKEAIKKLVNGLTEKKRIHTKNLDENGFSIIVERGPNGERWGEHIYHDPFLVSQTTNNIQIWDWNKVNRAFLGESNKILGGMYWLGDNIISTPQRLINSIWQQILLLRPARILRDVYQNYVSIGLSGYGKDVARANWDWIKESSLNLITKPKYAKDIFKDKMPFINKSSSPKEYRDAIRLVNEESDLLQESMRSIVSSTFTAYEKGTLENLTFKDLVTHLQNAKELQAEDFLHVSAFGAKTATGEASTRLDTRGIAVFKDEDTAKSFLASKAEAFGGVKPESTLKLPNGPDVNPMASPTVGKIAAELDSGNIVHIRGRAGLPWKLIDAQTLAKQTDAQVAKYQVRVVSGNALGNVLSRKDIADLVTQGNVVWYKDELTGWSVLTPSAVAKLPETLPKTVSLRVFNKDKFAFPEKGPIIPVKTYGETLTITPVFKDMPENIRGILGIKSQKELDNWINTRQYDNLGSGTGTGLRTGWFGTPVRKNPGAFDELEKLGIGRIKVVAKDGSETVVANPLLSDIGKLVEGKAVYETSQATRLIGIELEKMGVTQSDIEVFFKTFDNDLGLRDIFIGADPKYTALAEKVAALIKETETKLPAEIITMVKTAGANVTKLTKKGQTALDKLHASLGVDRASLLATTEAVKQRLVVLATMSSKLESGLIRANKLAEAKALRKEGRRIPAQQFAGDDIDINGVKFSDAFAGDSGNIAINQLRRDSRDARAFDATRPYGAIEEQGIIKPGDPQYWEAWANVLNRDFMFNGKIDPVIAKVILDAKQGYTRTEIRDRIVTWATSTPEGKAYANAVGIGKEFEKSIDPEVLVRPGAVRTEGISIDDFADNTIAHVENHVGPVYPDELILQDPDLYITNQIAEKMLAGERIAPSDIAEFRLGGEYRADYSYTGVKNLPDIWASKASPRYRNQVVANIAKSYDTFRRVTTESAQVYLAQTPVFEAAYRRSLTTQLERLKVSRGIKNDVEFKISDADRVQMEKKARAVALTETKKWVYSSIETKKWEDALRFMVPFANAQLFTLRTLGRAAMEQPFRLARMVYFLNKANENIKWIDKNGNEVAFDEVDSNGRRKAVATNLNLPPFVMDAINNVFGFEKGTGIEQLTWSRSSMDPVFQGNYGKRLFGIGPEVPFDTPNPFNGFSLTPSPAILLSEVSKFKADDPAFQKFFVDNFPQLMPFGPSQSAWSADILSPGGLAAAVVDSLVKGDGGRWQNTVLASAQFLTGAMLNGTWSVPNGSTLDREIEKHAATLFWVQTWSQFISPISTGYNTAGDLARKTWKSTIDKYNAEYDKDPSAWKNTYGERTPFQVAQQDFLINNEDLFYATTRENDRKYAQNVSADALSKIRKYKPILDDILDTQEQTGLSAGQTNQILSFISNEAWNKPATQSFDQTVWNTMISEGYIKKVTPEDMQNQVYLAKANAMYWNGFEVNGNKIMGMNEIQILSNGTGYLPDGTSVADAKSFLMKTIARDEKVGAAFSEQYIAPDPQKYDTNFRIWWKIMQGDNGQGDSYAQWWADHTDMNGMPAPLVKDITEFLVMRNGIRNQLNINGSNTGQYNINYYPQLKNKYDNQVALKRQANPDFDVWYHTFFEGDVIN